METINLEVVGAKVRFDRAKQAVDEFVSLHGDPFHEFRASSFAHRDSLEREFRALMTELDEAGRQFQKSLEGLGRLS